MPRPGRHQDRRAGGRPGRAGPPALDARRGRGDDLGREGDTGRSPAPKETPAAVIDTNVVVSGIRRVHALAEADVDFLLTDLALSGKVREPPAPARSLLGAGDRHLWALLAAEPTAILVTGDEALRKHAAQPSRVVSPRQVLALLREQ